MTNYFPTRLKCTTTETENQTIIQSSPSIPTRLVQPRVLPTCPLYSHYWSPVVAYACSPTNRKVAENQIAKGESSWAEHGVSGNALDVSVSSQSSILYIPRGNQTVHTSHYTGRDVSLCLNSSPIHQGVTELQPQCSGPRLKPALKHLVKVPEQSGLKFDSSPANEPQRSQAILSTAGSVSGKVSHAANQLYHQDVAKNPTCCSGGDESVGALQRSVKSGQIPVPETNHLSDLTNKPRQKAPKLNRRPDSTETSMNNEVAASSTSQNSSPQESIVSPGKSTLSPLCQSGGSESFILSSPDSVPPDVFENWARLDALGAISSHSELFEEPQGIFTNMGPGLNNSTHQKNLQSSNNVEPSSENFTNKAETIHCAAKSLPVIQSCVSQKRSAKVYPTIVEKKKKKGRPPRGKRSSVTEAATSEEFQDSSTFNQQEVKTDGLTRCIHSADSGYISEHHSRDNCSPYNGDTMHVDNGSLSDTAVTQSKATYIDNIEEQLGTEYTKECVPEANPTMPVLLNLNKATNTGTEIQSEIAETQEAIRAATSKVKQLIGLLTDQCMADDADDVSFTTGLLTVLESGCRVSNTMISSLGLLKCRQKHMGSPNTHQKSTLLPSLTQERPLDLRIVSVKGDAHTTQENDSYLNKEQMQSSASIPDITLNLADADSSADATSSLVRPCVVSLPRMNVPSPHSHITYCLKSKSWSSFTTHDYSEQKPDPELKLNNCSKSNNVSLATYSDSNLPSTCYRNDTPCRSTADETDNECNISQSQDLPGLHRDKASQKRRRKTADQVSHLTRFHRKKVEAHNRISTPIANVSAEHRLPPDGLECASDKLIEKEDFDSKLMVSPSGEGFALNEMVRLEESHALQKSREIPESNSTGTETPPPKVNTVHSLVTCTEGLSQDNPTDNCVHKSALVGENVENNEARRKSNSETEYENNYGRRYSRLSPDTSSSTDNLSLGELNVEGYTGTGSGKIVRFNAQNQEGAESESQAASWQVQTPPRFAQTSVKNQATTSANSTQPPETRQTTKHVHGSKTPTITPCRTVSGRKRGRPLGSTYKNKPPRKKRHRMHTRSSSSSATDNTEYDTEVSPKKRPKRYKTFLRKRRVEEGHTASEDVGDSTSEEVIGPRKSRGLTDRDRQGCFKVFDTVYNFEWSEPFREETNETEVPGYLRVVTKPTYLRLVACRLRKGEYPSPQAFVRDMRLVFSNCRLYHSSNPLPTSPKLLIAATLVEDYLNEQLVKIFPNEDFSQVASTKDSAPTAQHRAAPSGEKRGQSKRLQSDSYK